MARWRAMILLTLGLAAVTGCGTDKEMTAPPAAPDGAAQETIGEEAVVQKVEEAEQAAPTSELVGQGQAMAETLCSGCHAIGLTGESPNPESMPFRQISWHYPVEMLAESLAEGIMVAHPRMPQWEFEPQQIDALLAYLETVQVHEEE